MVGFYGSLLFSPSQRQSDLLTSQSKITCGAHANGKNYNQVGDSRTSCAKLVLNSFECGNKRSKDAEQCGEVERVEED